MSNRSFAAACYDGGMEWKAKIEDGLRKVSQQLFDQRNANGHWTGELSSSALATATAVTAIAFYLEATGVEDQELQQQVDAGISWLVGQQNEDGGFGDTPLSHSNISTAMLAVASLHACGKAEQFTAEIERAQAYIDSKGGIAGLRTRYGNDKTFAVPILAHCAMAGILPWREVSALPFEAACVPQRFYNLMQLPVVSYAIPALVAIGQAKFVNDPPWDPVRKTIRRLCVEPSLRVLERMQPESGGFLEAVPLTSFVAMALVKCGRESHPVVEAGVEFLRESFRPSRGCGFQPQSFGGESGRLPLDAGVDVRSEQAIRSEGFQSLKSHGNPDDVTAGSRRYDEREDMQIAAAGSRNHEQGTWPIDTNLATWGTTLTVNALANDVDYFREQLSANKQTWKKCVDWILGCQTKNKHPFTGAQPGGFGWTDLSGSVPDADDTPGALIALRHFHDHADLWCEPDELSTMRAEIENSARAAVQWLLDLQNRDSGFPTFCTGWGKLPFDRSGSDITAHSIRGLIAWQDKFSDPKIQKSIDRGFRYLSKQQRPDGNWLPLWFGNQDTEDEINPWYGTAKVLLAYRDANLFDTEPARIGLEWIAGSQNEDGGWGGGKSLDWPTLHRTFRSEHSKPGDFGVLGTSSVEETALCTETLLHGVECDGLDQQTRQRLKIHATRGVQWLLDSIDLDCVSVHWPIGFYFAKLWYYEKMYPLVFATGALAKALKTISDSPQNDINQLHERDNPGGTRRNICC
ncbi:prenyltransferase/squalene oxidase repeat-containing protein [Mariniblastus fucicola]|uniref:Sporulenol synthase n=1 Tax=Mariniblastus fucicola TaxID=980251 RepID=A0A5B9PCY7_9BACT|nr:prenyltransferase/squalene oxidase repeat-containing protein [Mariniblastus fucicola]QEG24218.1 Sporulenol synthase [Mariniblastus fucicola]